MESPDPVVFEMGEMVDDGACDGVVPSAAGNEDRVGVAGLVVRDGEAGAWRGTGRNESLGLYDLMQTVRMFFSESVHRF